MCVSTRHECILSRQEPLNMIPTYPNPVRHLFELYRHHLPNHFRNIIEHSSDLTVDLLNSAGEGQELQENRGRILAHEHPPLSLF